MDDCILTAERGSNSGSLAAVRAELADSITAEASARTQHTTVTQRLAANEKDSDYEGEEMRRMDML